MGKGMRKDSTQKSDSRNIVGAMEIRWNRSDSCDFLSDFIRAMDAH